LSSGSLLTSQIPESSLFLLNLHPLKLKLKLTSVDLYASLLEYLFRSQEFELEFRVWAARSIFPGAGIMGRRSSISGEVRNLGAG
jgi:hypothetical protein